MTCGTTSSSPRPTTCRSAEAGSGVASGRHRSTPYSEGGSLAAFSRRAADSRLPSSTERIVHSRGNAATSVPTASADPVPSDQSITHWLDINAFQRAALGTFGNCPVGVARAPGYANLDLVLSKRFDIRSSKYAEFRVEAFNATNHPSFGPPGRDLNAPAAFGVITNTISSPRVIEFALKFYF